MTTYLAVALGGAIGAVLRYWLSTTVGQLHGGSFPLGTFTVNLLGSFLIGALFVLFSDRAGVQYRPLLIVGLLGSLTTFSTFSLDALLLLQQGHYNTALLYLVGSVTTCLFAAFAGVQCTRLLF